MFQPLIADRSRRHSRRGFTLMELLVVIAIIAVLISFLLPALTQARRGANTVKCIAALKDIGNAFNMYAVDHKQAYPVVQHAAADTVPGGGTVTPGVTPSVLPAGNERHWCDLLARYATGTKSDMNNYLDIAQIKGKSTIWGCPEWQSSSNWDTAYTTGGIAFPNTYETGYGMNPIANPDDYSKGGALAQNALAWISTRTSGAVSGVLGAYHKTNIWGHKAADHLLVADSQVYYTIVARTITPTFPVTYSFQGYSGAPPAPKDMQWPPGPTGGDMMMDGSRHLKGGYPKDKIVGLKGMNALFCDGHAETINVHDAWTAMLYPNLRH